MKYVPPYGSTDADEPYNDLNESTATYGDAVPAAAIEHPMREIMAVISGAGLTPSNSDLTQLYQAINKIVATNARTVLTANKTVYVATTGNDATGDGTAALPWATLQHAWAVILNTYDLRGYTATIQLADGTYGAGLTATGMPMGYSGVGCIVVAGNAASPTNTTISPAAGDTLSVSGVGLTVQNVKLTCASGASCMKASDGGKIAFSGVNFGACAGGTHINAYTSGSISAVGNYTISGGATAHLNLSSSGARVDCNGITVTLTGTPAFSTAFANAAYQGLIHAQGATFTGAATGARYYAQTNSVIQTYGGGASYFPGNAAGSTTTGGIYQ